MPAGPDSDAAVITGIGLCTSLGLDAESTWRSMCRGECGVGLAPALESSLSPDPGAGQVEGPHAPEDSCAGREVIYLRRAVQEALDQARARADFGDARRGFVLGTTLHGMRHGGRFLRTADFEPLRRFLAGATLNSACDGSLDVAWTTCSACSSGLASISVARSLLCTGEVDMAVAGGYDPISEYSYAGFNSMRLVSPTTVRPFAADRDGMKVAEGYAVVVLEREETAVDRGAMPLARVVGMGESCDAFHLSKPHPEGAGAAAAIRQAISDAGIEAGHIDLIIAHGTATIENDAAEYAALMQVFGERLADIPLLATKSHLGHSLGAAGAVDLIVAALALRDGVVPPCAHLRSDAPLIAAVQPIRGVAKRMPLEYVLTVSLGFGGANMAAVVAAPGSASGRKPARIARRHIVDSDRQRVAVSGVGVVVPGGAGNQAFLRLLDGANGPARARSSTVTQEELEPLINARRTRRMSEFAKLSIAATAEALRHACVHDPALFCEDCSAVLATMHGPTGFCEAFYRQIVEEGPAAANPSLFAEGVPNVASAHLSTNFGIKGFCQTLIGSRTAGLDALSLAFVRIRSGEWQRAIVGAAEECTPLLHEVYGRLLPAHGETPPLCETSCAVALVLESAESLGARSGHPIAYIEGAMSRDNPLRTPMRIRRDLREIAEFLGEADACLCTMNGTWIDALERRGLPHKLRRVGGSLYALVGEAFSAAPLLGLSAALLRRSAPQNIAQSAPANSVARGGALGIICADYFGGVGAMRMLLA